MPLCSVITCVCSQEDNSGIAENITFHRFPKVEEIRAKWVDMTGRVDWSPGPDSYVCSRHFRETDFFTRRSGKRYLKTSAIPCEHVFYRHLFPDEVPAVEEANEAEVKVECVPNEVNDDEDVGAVARQVDPRPEYYDERPPRPFSPLTVQPVHEADSTMAATIYDDEPTRSWEHFRPDRYFEERLPTTIFGEQSSQQADSSFEARYHREVRSAIIPLPLNDISFPLQQMARPRAPERSEVELAAPTPGPSVSRRRRDKLDDIEAIISRRRASKKDDSEDRVPENRDQLRESRCRSRLSIKGRRSRPQINNKIVMDANGKKLKMKLSRESY